MLRDQDYLDTNILNDFKNKKEPSKSEFYEEGSNNDFSETKWRDSSIRHANSDIDGLFNDIMGSRLSKHSPVIKNKSKDMTLFNSNVTTSKFLLWQKWFILPLVWNDEEEMQGKSEFMIKINRIP